MESIPHENIVRKYKKYIPFFKIYTHILQLIKKYNIAILFFNILYYTLEYYFFSKLQWPIQCTSNDYTLVYLHSTLTWSDTRTLDSKRRIL